MRDHRGGDAGNPHGAARRARQAVRESQHAEAADIGRALGLGGEKADADVRAERRQDRVDFTARLNQERRQMFLQRQAELPEDVPPRGRGR